MLVYPLMLCLFGRLISGGLCEYDDCLEEQIRLFLKFLKVKPQNNYFTCYSYAHPVLNSLPFSPLVQGLITNIVLLVCTPNEIFVKR